jgi:hypothetical protein
MVSFRSEKLRAAVFAALEILCACAILWIVLFSAGKYYSVEATLPGVMLSGKGLSITQNTALVTAAALAFCSAVFYLARRPRAAGWMAFVSGALVFGGIMFGSSWSFEETRIVHMFFLFQILLLFNKDVRNWKNCRYSRAHASVIFAAVLIGTVIWFYLTGLL